MHNLKILSWLFFLVNAVKFNVTDEDGGGSAGSEGSEGNSEGGAGAGAEGGAGEGGSGGSGEAGTGGEGGQGAEGGNGEGGQVDLSSLPEATQKYIKDLRKENAGYRTNLRTSEDRLGRIEQGLQSMFGEEGEDQVSPEERIQGLTQTTEALSMQNAVLSIALETGLSGDQAQYFQFLLQKEAEGLEENEEISEERFDALISTVKGVQGQNGGTGSTSVDGGGKPPQGGGTEVTAEQFGNMSYMEKVNLRKANEPLYNKLFAAAKL